MKGQDHLQKGSRADDYRAKIISDICHHFRAGISKKKWGWHCAIVNLGVAKSFLFTTPIQKKSDFGF